MKTLLTFTGVTTLLTIQAFAALPAPDADNGGISLPPGFAAVVVADNLVVGHKTGNNTDRLRFLAVAPNGDVYAKTSFGGIIALRDTDGDGKADVKQEFGSGGGTGIAVHDGSLYHSTNDAVYRYRLTPGELVPAGEPELMVSGLPNEKHTHDAKSFTFDDRGHLLVEVGSPYNVYSDGDRGRGAKGRDATEFLKTHGGFWRFDADKPGQAFADGFHFSTGHRHSLAVAWNRTAQAFFMVMMGRDQLNTVAPEFYDDQDNAERVAEEMHRLHEGVNLGWPYTYYDPIRKARMVAPEFGGDNEKRAEPGKYDEPLVAFPAHWAPLQMAFYYGEQFPEKYRGGAFIAFHGSWNRAPKSQQGYKVAFVPFDEKGMPTGEYESFADGFSGRVDFTSTRDARFRPAGLAVGPDGSLYVGDSEKGRIWRIFYVGNNPARRTSEGATSKSSEDAQSGKRAPVASVTPVSAVEKEQSTSTKPARELPARGRKIYAQQCATCHMADGSGVASLQPALTNDPIVSGDAARLIDVVLRGPAAVLPADRPRYANAMPGFAHLTNAELADLLTFVRGSFGNDAPAVKTADVAAKRAK
jgi:glucose/arabinose dehydrogenase/mono/diheme cytochrome c family protein